MIASEPPAQRPGHAPGRRSVMLIGVVVPSALVAAASLVTLGLLPRLPARVAVHWSLSGHADGFAGPWVTILVPPVVTGLMGTLMTTAALQLLHGDGTIGQLRFRAAWGPWLAATSLTLVYPAAWTQAVHPAGIVPPWWIAGASPLAALLALGSVLLIPRSAIPPPGRDDAESGADAPALRLTPTQRGVWSGTTRHTALLWLVPVGTAVWAGLAVRSEDTAVHLAVAAALVVTILAPWHVTVDRSGVVVRPFFAYPRYRYRFDAIRRATTLTVRPLADFGGWGIRLGPRRRHGVITAGGPALAIELRSGRTFVVTVNDPDTAVRLINGYKLHKETQRA